MTEPAATPRPQSCLSDLALDEIIAARLAEPPQASPPATNAHLQECVHCAERLSLLEQTAADALPAIAALATRASQSARDARAPAHAGAGWRRWSLVGLGGALAIAAALLVGLPQPPSGDHLKGVGMRFFVLRHGQVNPGVSGSTYEAGDALRFAVSSDRDGYVLLVGIDAEGNVTAYHPWDGTQSATLSGGIDVPLPGSLVLDDAPGAELFVGFFTPTPLALTRVREAVHAAGPPRERLSPAWAAGLDLPGSRDAVLIHRPRSTP
jgi:hypothetical protein